jgi:hypothetical protein
VGSPNQPPDYYGHHTGLPDRQPLEGPPAPGAYGGGPVDINTTVVHHDVIAESTNWLQRCTERLDQLIADLQDIPRSVGNPVLNPDSGIDTSRGTIAPTGRKVEGQLGAPGPTKFGLHPNGRQLALAHVNTFNQALVSLHDIRDNLHKALEGTKYIAQQYKRVEEANATDIARIMTSPPYQPGADT